MNNFLLKKNIILFSFTSTNLYHYFISFNTRSYKMGINRSLLYYWNHYNSLILYFTKK